MSLSVTTSLADQVQKVQQASTDVPTEVSAALTEGSALHDKLQGYGTSVASMQQTTVEQFAALEPARSSFETDMQARQQDIQGRVDSATGDYQALHASITTSQQNIADALQQLTKKAADLQTKVGAVRDMLTTAAQQQQTAIDTGLKLLATAQDQLTQASKQAGDLVATVETASQTATTDAGTAMGTISDSLTNAQQHIGQSMDDFEAVMKAALAALANQLPDVEKKVLEARTSNCATTIQQTLDQQVVQASQALIQAYIDQAITLMATQGNDVQTQVKQKDDPLEKMLKDIQAGPLLPPMLTRAKLILQRIGQGPAAQFLQAMAALDKPAC